MKHDFRVLAGFNPAPVSAYAGNNIRAALDAFYKALPDGPFVMRHSNHIVTGEPVIEVRDADSGRMVTALYGVTAGEWKAALELDAMLQGRWQ